MADPDLEALLTDYGTYVAIVAVVWIVFVLPQFTAAGTIFGWVVAVVLVALVVLDLYYQYRRVVRGR